VALFQKSYVDLVCALCGRKWAECSRMVEGQRGAMCIDCVPVTVSAFEGPDSLALTVRVLLDVVSRRNPKTPLADSKRLLDAIALLANNDLATVRHLEWQAIRLGHYDAAIELGERIPEEQREPNDRINAAFASYRLGRWQYGLNALAALDVSKLEAEHRALYLMNHAALAFESEPEAPPQRLDELHSRIEEARMLVLMLPVDGDLQRRYLAGIAEGQARYAFRTRDHKRAVERAQDAKKLTDEPSSSALMLLGDAHAALGDDKAAHAAWLEVLRVAHPESRDAQHARKRLTGVYR
jgi:hypothetical protein